ncbi:MAG: 30S ribosomal protein S1, partial [Nonlabens sp.]
MAENQTNKEWDASQDGVADAQTEKKTPVITSPQQEDPAAFLDSFDWERYSEGIEKVDEEQLKAFEKLVSDNFVDTIDTDVIEGVV